MFRRLLSVLCVMIFSCCLFSCATVEKPVNVIFYQPEKSLASVARIKELAIKNDSWAQLMLAFMYRTGVSGLDEDPWAFVNWLQKSADNENPFAQYMTGLLYYSGFFVPENKKIAFTWFARSAELGFASAQLMTSVQYMLEEYHEWDLEKAYFWCLLSKYAKRSAVSPLIDELRAMTTDDPSEKEIIDIANQIYDFETSMLDSTKQTYEGFCVSFQSMLDPMTASAVIEKAQRWQSEKTGK